MTPRVAPATPQLHGASVLEQRLHDHVIMHIDGELDVLRRYQELVDSADSPAFAFLAQLILDDERRHHQLLRDLADTIRIDASLSGDPTPVPALYPFLVDREAIREQTRTLLELEREDNRELGRLAKELHELRDTTLWQLVVRMLQADNAKHQMILEFIADRVKH